MDQHLHGLFAQALDDEPPPPPADLTRSAMARGTRMRRRRQAKIGGIAGGALAATLLALNLAVPGRDSAPATEPAGLPAAGASRCVPLSAVAVFLRSDVTDKQRAGLRSKLTSAPGIQAFSYESREQAYEKFAQLWQDSPDFVQSVNATQLPDAFRIQLTAPSQYPAFAAAFTGQPGVQELIPDGCPPSVGPGAGQGAPAGPTAGEAR
jgi:cell division transport system permease protein